METDWMIMNNNDQIKYKKIEKFKSITINIPHNIDYPYVFLN